MTASHATGFAGRHATIKDNAWYRERPIDRERLVDLDLLTRLDTATAENALRWIVPIEGMRVINLIGLWPIRLRLVVDTHVAHGVVKDTVSVVVVTDRAVEVVIDQKPLTSTLAFALGRSRGHHLLARDVDFTSALGDSIHGNEAQITGSNGSEHRVITNLWQLDTGPVDHLDHQLSLGGLDGTRIDSDGYTI
jgi:hypothetical protein